MLSFGDVDSIDIGIGILMLCLARAAAFVQELVVQTGGVCSKFVHLNFLNPNI